MTGYQYGNAAPEGDPGYLGDLYDALGVPMPKLRVDVVDGVSIVTVNDENAASPGEG